MTINVATDENAKCSDVTACTLVRFLARTFTQTPLTIFAADVLLQSIAPPLTQRPAFSQSQTINAGAQRVGAMDTTDATVTKRTGRPLLVMSVERENANDTSAALIQ